jgi:crotonobetainyl-CoA:carnitine CoA-transferase CaiB-like acyl-CoA transferase
MNKTLDGIRVLELAQYISGPYCGMLLAGLGARVTKIEKPVVGDLSRRCGPFPENIPHTDKSGLFHYLNRNKRGITLDIRKTTGREIFLEFPSPLLARPVPIKIIKPMPSMRVPSVV